MFQIIHVSDSYKHFSDCIDEYHKRIDRLELIRILPEKNGDITKRTREETKRIVEYLKKRSGYTILLDVVGKQLSTEEYATLLENMESSHSLVQIIIGGAYGVDRSLLSEYIDTSISLSHMTFPHHLALLILLEQTYRAQTIWKNIPYHHA